MKDTERRAAAKSFSEYWKERGYEKGESQPFWLSLLRDVLGVESPEQFITFEEQVRLDHTSFIDGIIPSTLPILAWTLTPFMWMLPSTSSVACGFGVLMPTFFFRSAMSGVPCGTVKYRSRLLKE